MKSLAALWQQIDSLVGEALTMPHSLCVCVCACVGVGVDDIGSKGKAYKIK